MDNYILWLWELTPGVAVIFTILGGSWTFVAPFALIEDLIPWDLIPWWYMLVSVFILILGLTMPTSDRWHDGPHRDMGLWEEKEAE